MTEPGSPRADPFPGLFPSALALTSDPFPGPVYHYTDQRGFLGILADKTIWATDLRYLNDTREYSLGFDRILHELRSRWTEGSPLAGLLSDTFQQLRAEAVVGLSVASFSLIEDDLSQWRAYGGGSGGFCVGFEPGELEIRIRRTGSTFGAVRYLDSEQGPIVRRLCDEIISDAESVVAGIASVRSFETRCSLSVQLTCALLKDEKFAAEREWRMIVWSSLPPAVVAKMRAGRSTLVPYVEVHLDFRSSQAPDATPLRLPFAKIWVGPTPHQNLALRATLLALQQTGEGAEVLPSAVSFRNW